MRRPITLAWSRTLTTSHSLGLEWAATRGPQFPFVPGGEDVASSAARSWPQGSTPHGGRHWPVFSADPTCTVSSTGFSTNVGSEKSTYASPTEIANSAAARSAGLSRSTRQSPTISPVGVVRTNQVLAPGFPKDVVPATIRRLPPGSSWMLCTPSSRGPPYALTHSTSPPASSLKTNRSENPAPLSTFPPTRTPPSPVAKSARGNAGCRPVNRLLQRSFPDGSTFMAMAPELFDDSPRANPATTVLPSVAVATAYGSVDDSVENRFAHSSVLLSESLKSATSQCDGVPAAPAATYMPRTRDVPDFIHKDEK